MRRTLLLVLALTLVAAVVAGPSAARLDRATATVGTSFPSDFPVIVDHSLGVPVIGFGAAGPVTRTPVIFLHGNNDTPYPTTCNGGFGKVQAFAQYLADHGYALSELWALGYQGEQCDLVTSPPNRSGVAHSTVANVPDLRAFVRAVLAYTGATRVDIVGHSLGATLAREWMRQDHAHGLVRRLVSVDGPNHGIINCSPNPQNFWQAAALGGFTPDSAICVEYGAANTPFLLRLNKYEAKPPTGYLAIRNTDTSFVFFPLQDGLVPPVPAEDRNGLPHDFSQSARIQGARNVGLVGQGQYDGVLLSTHLGILNSPQTWQLTLAYLTTRKS
jgi:pimeloyl-ACP methyl ester carboxylesterase